MTPALVLAVATDRKVGLVRQRGEHVEQPRRLGLLELGLDLANTGHHLPDLSIEVRCINAALGASVGSQTSYQSSLANFVFGTPRGGRRTVPRRRPSPLRRVVPNRTIRIAISGLAR